MDLYVYYEVASADLAATATRVRAMQASLEAAGARLQRRAEKGLASETWMEVYERVGADFEARLDAAADAHGLPAPRHVERFVDVG